MRNLMTNTRFMLLWSAGSIVSLFASTIVSIVLLVAGGFVATFLFGEQSSAASPIALLLFLSVFFSSIGLASGLVFGSVQKTMLRMHTREPWRGWLIASSIGGVLGIDIVAVLLVVQGGGYLLWMVMPPIETLFWFGFQVAVVFFGCLGLSQMFVLWKFVRGAWVWVLANIVAGVVLYSLVAFGLLSLATSPLIVILLLFFVAASPGIVTGFALVWLISSNWRGDY